VGGLKKYIEGMMSNGKKVRYTERKKGGKKELTHHTRTNARTNIGIRQKYIRWKEMQDFGCRWQ